MVGKIENAMFLEPTFKLASLSPADDSDEFFQQTNFVI